MEKRYREDDMEIDLLELLFEFKKRAWVIILAAVLGCLGAGAYSRLILTPVYTSTAMVYVLSKETTLTSLADLQIGSQLTKDYSVMITSRPVLEQVIENQGLNMTYGQLKARIRISNPADTRILNMTVSDTDPVRAKAIADEVANASSDYIGDIMEMVPPKIIEQGVVPAAPASPSIKKNAALGGLACIAAACGGITLKVIMNDTIRSEEDVGKYLGMSVLASVPDDDGMAKEQQRNRSKRKLDRKRRRTEKNRKGE